MKKYLFGLGAMVAGAGLMFVLMHGEVSADSKPEPFVCSEPTLVKSALLLAKLWNCRVKNTTCVIFRDSAGKWRSQCSVNNAGLFK